MGGKCGYSKGWKLWENAGIPVWSRQLLLAMVTAVCGSMGCAVAWGSVVTPSFSAQRDLSHWNKVKVLLNRIRWKSSQHPASPAPPHGPAPR